MQTIRNNTEILIAENQTNITAPKPKIPPVATKSQIANEYSLSDREINLPKFNKPEVSKQLISEDRYALFKKYVAGDTSEFSADDWIYLIIKMGKRLMTPPKLQKLQSFFTVNEMPLVLKKRATLQCLRTELEDIVYQSKWHVRSHLYSSYFKTLVFIL